MKQQAYRLHDFSYGHRVYGHENKCANLHGHNGRVHFYCEGDQDAIGRVIEFGLIKERLCVWLEDHWDHRLLLWESDSWAGPLSRLDEKVVFLPFNPTAENMAKFLLETVGPYQLSDTGVKLVKVIVDETRKCSGIAEL